MLGWGEVGSPGSGAGEAECTRRDEVHWVLGRGTLPSKGLGAEGMGWGGHWVRGE